jgi:predicted small metal-binding protein
MKKRIVRCYEVAIGSNNDCNFEISGDTEEEFYRNIVDHIQKEHDLRSEDLKLRLEKQIRNLIGLAGSDQLNKY